MSGGDLDEVRGSTWEETVNNLVKKYGEFSRQFPNSRLIPQIWVRRAELYLTISRGEVDEKTYQYYGRLAWDALTAAIEAEAYANIPHYSYLGGKKFGYAGDTVGSVALYMRATFFSKTRAKDLEELKTKFPDSPSTVKALQELQPAR